MQVVQRESTRMLAQTRKSLEESWFPSQRFHSYRYVHAASTADKDCNKAWFSLKVFWSIDISNDCLFAVRHEKWRRKHSRLVTECSYFSSMFLCCHDCRNCVRVRLPCTAMALMLIDISSAKKAFHPFISIQFLSNSFCLDVSSGILVLLAKRFAPLICAPLLSRTFSFFSSLASPPEKYAR